MAPAEKMKVEASYDSIYSALEKRARAVRFSSDFVAVQITLDYSVPMYIRVEDMIPEIAPYEYNDATFYIDGTSAAIASVLNGNKSIYDAIDDGSVRVNGDANAAILFIHTLFG
jgi:hypothetical protein